MTTRRTLAAAALAASTLATLALGTGSAHAVTSGIYCGATQQFAGDVYAQACVSVSGTSVFPLLHVTNHGNHAITGVVWVNHLGSYEDYNTCYGMTASDPGSWCNAGWDPIGAGGYAQAQGQLVIDGSWSGKVFSPSEYIG
ncbi:hypothetical protein ACFYUY_08425 [Kitasatospora sp. NPDC004745]|uniref:hypothetical protein n=1 Tax=Kitasatospora sp. NPDC004745 TaxID=3364019 RepID=UPI003698CDAE